MAEMQRREFLTVAGGAALAAARVVRGEEPAAETRQPVKLAVMGVNGRGKGLLSGFSRFPEVEIAYVCDPDSQVLPEAAKIVEGQGKTAPKLIADFREALDDKSVTALVCAAPDHWHALATILACQAGKDVYVEKPVSHNIVEGRLMVEAARKYKRVVQAGTQRRSSLDTQAAVREIQSGRLGDVHMVRAWITSTRPNIGHAAVSMPPEHLDFNLWAGPGPGNDYRTNLVHYNWHWRWDYGTGECGNNGVHALDVARWGLGVTAPESVSCGGGKYTFDDDQETPDTQLAIFNFPGKVVTWEHRTWSKRELNGQGFGVEFIGTEATLITDGRGWKVVKGDKELAKQAPTDYEVPHFQNFLDCIVSREQPNADIEIGHHSAQLCHLANIAWRTGSTLHWQDDTIRDNPAAQALLGREYRKGFEIPASI